MSQAEGPWQNTARLGSPHSEPARLTVGELPSRHVRRVNRHTPKKGSHGRLRRRRFRPGRRGQTGNGRQARRPVLPPKGGWKRCSLSRSFFGAVAQRQSPGLSIQSMSVQLRFAPPSFRSGGQMVKPRGFQPRNCGFESRPDLHGPVAQWEEHATDNREGGRSNRSRSTTSGSSSIWQSACLGRRGLQVQILPSRPHSETRKAGVLIGLESRDVRKDVEVRSL